MKTFFQKLLKIFFQKKKKKEQIKSDFIYTLCTSNELILGLKFQFVSYFFVEPLVKHKSKSIMYIAHQTISLSSFFFESIIVDKPSLSVLCGSN